VTEIRVACAPTPGGWSCIVDVADGRAGHEFQVRVSAAELARFAPGAADPADLVRRSFEFLLEREPLGSILRSFDLSVISRYFPEYEREIMR
jgi:hypothetical protein